MTIVSRNYPDKKTGGHLVRLTEKDLLLLEGLLAEYMPEGDDKHATSEHIVDMFGKIQLMLTDY